MSDLIDNFLVFVYFGVVFAVGCAISAVLYYSLVEAMLFWQVVCDRINEER